jgi:hypothetical protein
MVGVPLHEPADALSVWPCCAVPLMTGGDVLDGESADGEGADGVGVGKGTAAVGGEVAAADPLRLLAVTMTRSVAPPSVVETLYVCADAPVTERQLAPLESQRSH